MGNARLFALPGTPLTATMIALIASSINNLEISASDVVTFENAALSKDDAEYAKTKTSPVLSAIGAIWSPGLPHLEIGIIDTAQLCDILLDAEYPDIFDQEGEVTNQTALKVAASLSLNRKTANLLLEQGFTGLAWRY